jgi:hypothetical protein
MVKQICIASYGRPELEFDAVAQRKPPTPGKLPVEQATCLWPRKLTTASFRSSLLQNNKRPEFAIRPWCSALCSAINPEKSHYRKLDQNLFPFGLTIRPSMKGSQFLGRDVCFRKLIANANLRVRRLYRSSLQPFFDTTVRVMPRTTPRLGAEH